MYPLYESLSSVCIVVSGTTLAEAVVAAPIWKEWPEQQEQSMPAFMSVVRRDEMRACWVKGARAFVINKERPFFKTSYCHVGQHCLYRANMRVGMPDYKECYGLRYRSFLSTFLYCQLLVCFDDNLLHLLKIACWFLFDDVTSEVCTKVPPFPCILSPDSY